MLDAATYNAFFGIQARIAGSSAIPTRAIRGFGTEEFKNGLFDTDNGGKKIQSVIEDATLTKADIEAGKTLR